MLKAAKETDKIKIENFCKAYPLGVRISCQMNAYGFERDFLRIWFAENETGVIAALSSFDGSVTLCTSKEADFEEIRVFICSIGFESLCAEKEVFELCGFEETSQKRMFVYNGGEEVFDAVQNSSEHKQVYNLISSSIEHSFPNTEEAYLHFLSDFTFRQRRGLARLKTIYENEKVLSCALTAAESDYAAIISGVACDKSQRGKGIGKKTVLTLAGELKKENKEVYVIALNDSAGAFYEKIGFEQCITVCYSER